MYYAGIDLGTTGCKSMVIDGDGEILGEGHTDCELLFVAGGVEQDARAWWRDAKNALALALDRAEEPARDVRARLAGIGVCAQGISSVPVDEGGEPLANAVSWYDGRAAAQGAALAERFGARWLFETTGRQPGSLFFPQILRLKELRPDIYGRAAHFLMAHDYLVYRLCGVPVTDYTMASGTLCFDTQSHAWIPEIFGEFGVDMGRFPALKPFGQPAGRILPKAADELGVTDQALIAVGMQDQKAAALGAGIGPGVMTVSLGTASAISVLAGSRARDAAVACHAFDGRRWIMENSVGAAGAALRWIRDVMRPGMEFGELDAMAERSPASAGGVRFSPALDAAAGEFGGLSLETGAADLVRAVMEGVAGAVAECAAAQRAATAEARAVSEVRAFGNGARSDLWLRMLEERLKLPVRRPRTLETASLGAAMCAVAAAAPA